MRFENGVVTDNDLVITTSKGNLLKEMPWEDNWYFWPLTWLNQDQLIIKLLSQANNQEASDHPKILILNPFTDEHEIVALDFPELYIPIGPGSTIASWSPKLDQVAYVQGDANTWSSPIYYTLWDVTAAKPITKLEILNDVNAVPRWRQDGEVFAIAQNFVVDEDIRQSFEKWPYYEIHLLNRNGEMSQLTNFTDYYPYTYIEDLSWSPDGKQIAFWFSHWDEPPEDVVYGEQHIAVVDTTTGEVNNYCIPGDYNAQVAGFRNVPPPLWSPDGKQLLVVNLYFDDHIDKKSQLILVDLEQQIAIKVGENLKPVGWMISPSE